MWHFLISEALGCVQRGNRILGGEEVLETRKVEREPLQMDGERRNKATEYAFFRRCKVVTFLDKG